MRTAVADGGFYCVTCYIGFCTLRCTKMDSKKKKPAVGLRVDFWCAGEPWALRRLAVPPESAAPVNVERSESRVDPGSVVARVQ